MVKVSVIVPVYNSELYLTSCVTSLINQTLDDLEIIIIDDGSTDNSLGIANIFANEFSNIKVITNNQNRGQSYARNRGLMCANGEYIGFVDSDDFIHPDMYKLMYEKAARNDYPEMVSCRIAFMEEDTELPNFWNQFRRKQSNLVNLPYQKDALYSLSPSCCNKLFRRDFIENQYFIEGKMWEDYGFCYSNAIRSNHILVLDSADYYYRNHLSGSVSKQNHIVNPRLLDIFTMCDYIEREAKRVGVYGLYQDEIKSLQSTFVLQRIEEIISWDIPNDSKRALITDLHTLLCLKYGNWLNYDLGYIGSRVNLILLDHFKINTMINFEDENGEKLITSINKRLTLLK